MRMRWTYIAASVLLAASVTACSNGSSTTATTSPTGATPSTAPGPESPAASAPESPAASALDSIGNAGPELCNGKEYSIGYDVFSDKEAFAVAFTKGLQETADKIGCVELTTLVDNLDPSTTQQNFDLVAQRKLQGLISFQALVDLYPGLVRKMETANIPMLTIGLSTPGVVFVNHSDKNAGFAAGKLLGEAFMEAHPGELPYVFRGDYAAGGQTQTDRMDGFVSGIESVLGEIPGDQVISIETKADPVEANSAMKAALASVPKDALLAVSSPGDETTNAMLQAAKGDGRASQTLAVGIGLAGTAGPEFVCKNPEYVGGVAFGPENWGNYALPAIIAMINGEKAPDFVEVPVKVVPRAEIGELVPGATC